MNADTRTLRMTLLLGVAAGLCFVLLWLKNHRALERRTYPVQIRLAGMEGLALGSEVRLEGFPIGRVQKVDIRMEGVRYVFLVTASVREGVPLFEGTTALVESKSFGSSFIALKAPAEAERRRVLAAHAVVYGSVGIGATDVVRHADVLVAELAATVALARQQLQAMSAGRVFSEARLREWADATTRSLGHLERSLAQAEALSGRAGHSLDTLDAALEATKGSAQAVEALLKGHPEALERILANADRSLAELARLGHTANGALEAAGPALQADLEALRGALASARELVEVLKARPSRVLHGKPTEAELEAAKRRAAEPVKPTADR